MRSVSAMTMRRHFGQFLDEVRYGRKAVIIERDGKPMALLSPLQDDGSLTMRRKRHAALERCATLGGPTKRGRAAGQWVKDERADWERRAT